MTILGGFFFVIAIINTKIMNVCFYQSERGHASTTGVLTRKFDAVFFFLHNACVGSQIALDAGTEHKSWISFDCFNRAF